MSTLEMRRPAIWRDTAGEPARAASPPRDLVAATLLGLGVLALLLLVSPGALGPLDGQSMYQFTRSIVERGDFTVSGAVYGVAGLHGQFYSKYGPGQSLLAVPLYVAGRAMAPLVPVSLRPEVPTLAASLLPALATALAVAVLMLAARELGASRRGAMFLSLIYLLATPAIVYATQWFSEALTACTLLVAFYLLLIERARPRAWHLPASGAALALAVATRLDAVLIVPPLLLYAVSGGRLTAGRLMAILSPLALALAGLGLYDQARFGSPLETGYSGGDVFAVRDTHPVRSLSSLAEGLYGLLLSPGKGLLFYAPPVLLAPFGAVALWARRRAEAVTLLAVIAVYALAHANLLIRWLGGWSWGPRFLMPVLPFAVLLLVPLLRPGLERGRLTRGVLLVLALVGVVVQIPAVAVQQPTAYIRTLEVRYGIVDAPHQVALTERMEADYVSQPDLSPIVGSWRMLGAPSTWQAPTQSDAAWVARKFVAFAPHTWWRMLSLQGVAPLPLAGVALCCLLIGAACLLAVWRRLGGPETAS
jgi:4-amino-4-deoxy-L-arabinose transferase-like glycosyltransferase